MESYDYFMILVLVGATVFGAWKGMAWQIASLASLLVSYFMSLSFSAQFAPIFGSQEPLNRYLAMFAVYMLSSFTIWLLFRVVGGAIDRMKMKEFDRQIGAIFGLAKGVLLCVVITFFAVLLLPADKKELILNSKSGYYVAVFLNESDSVMPHKFQEMIGPYIERAQETLDPKGTASRTRKEPTPAAIQ